VAADTDATVAKVDIDANQQLAAQYGVRSVPTLLLFAGGQQVEQVVGVQPPDQLRALVESYT
jgi:thioredoxin 1